MNECTTITTSKKETLYICEGWIESEWMTRVGGKKIGKSLGREL